LPALMDDLVTRVANSDLVKAQLLKPNVDVFTGMPFETSLTMQQINMMLQMMPDAAQKDYLTNMIDTLRAQNKTDEEIARQISELISQNDDASSYEENLEKIGYSQLEKPKQINIYPKDFEAKEVLTTMISNYNNEVEEGKKITYVDMIGLMLSSVSAIVTGVSTVLICFVGISLVVSSIMIGIITYISVLERTKEIGILRAIGASKRDISRVFNAETTIIGLAAGVFGILATLLLTIPINAIIRSFTDIAATAMISIWNVLILVAISVILTLIAGLIPARMAAKKDPVIALRSE
jgi:putative ABC transport system permease protein